MKLFLPRAKQEEETRVIHLLEGYENTFPSYSLRLNVRVLRGMVYRYEVFNRRVRGKAEFVLCVEDLNDDVISDFMEYICAEHRYYNVYLEVYISVGYVLGCRRLNDFEIENIRNRLCHFVSWWKEVSSTSKV